jgi:uncharacterized repeat protein (TIGR01451 family)/LPXTG-motif cell wall-anchored protein
MPLVALAATMIGVLLVGGGIEAAAAPSGAPVLGITPTSTPTATPTVTPRPTGTRPSYGDCNLIVTKQAEPTEVRPGDDVRFTIWVTNEGQKAAINTYVIDEIPEYLEILDVSTSQGTWRQEGQKIIVEIGTIGQGYVVEIVIDTRVREDAPTPLSLENLAIVKTDNCADPSALAIVRVIGDPVTLPVTGGFSTWWLLAAVLGTGLVAASLVVSRRSES